LRQIGCYRSEDVKKFSIMPPELIWVNKTQAETDENYRQIIPYAVLKYTDKYFIYQRKNQAEKRFNGQWSLGVGGHLEREDYLNAKSQKPWRVLDAVENCFIRELIEEIPNIFECISFLNTAYNFLTTIDIHATDLDKYHIGAAYLANLKTDNLLLSDEVHNGHFVTKEEFKNYDLESWSEYLVDFI